MPKNNQQTTRVDEDLDDESARLVSESQQQMRLLKKKHPDCIPVYFARHKDAPKTLKQPTQPFMLFKKDLPIEQAMYRLYQQIDTKGLFFFCLHLLKDKIKYVRIQPGPTIEQMYHRYGKDEFLTLIYGNGQMGLEGMQKMQKCLIIVLIIIGTIWLSLYAYKFMMTANQSGSQQINSVPQSETN